MMRCVLLASLVTISLTAAETTPAADLEPQSYTCVVHDFLDDSRYPEEDDFVELGKATTVSIIDAGDRLIVKRKFPGSEVDSRHLPVTKRIGDTVVAQTVDGEYYSYSVMLQASQDPEGAAIVSGTLVDRTYEIDHTWLFRCGR